MLATPDKHIFISLRQKCVTNSCGFLSTVFSTVQTAKCRMILLSQLLSMRHQNNRIWDEMKRKNGWFTVGLLLLGARENRSGAFICFTSLRIWRSRDLDGCEKLQLLPSCTLWAAQQCTEPDSFSSRDLLTEFRNNIFWNPRRTLNFHSLDLLT